MFEQPDEFTRTVFADRNLQRFHACHGTGISDLGVCNFPIDALFGRHAGVLADASLLASAVVGAYGSPRNGEPQMPKKLDYNAAWTETTMLLRGHGEAIVAITGFFIFLASWAFAFIAPQPNLTGATTPAEIFAILSSYFQANWMYILPMMLVTTYGGLVIYVLLTRQNLSKVGDALTHALVLFGPYFVASILIGWLTGLGFVAFLLPGLYLTGRFSVLPAVMAANPQLGIAGSIKDTWNLTANVGWAALFLLLVVGSITWLMSVVANLIVGLVCLALGGRAGLPLVETGFSALFSTAQAVILIALTVAIFSQLRQQTSN
jgi:hypothetical protein